MTNSLALHPELQTEPQGTSTAPTNSGQPTSAPVKLLANKYKDPTELERGYMNLQTEAGRQNAELQRERQRAQALEQMLLAQASGSERNAQGARAAARAKDTERLESEGIPVDALVSLISETVQTEADKLIASRLAPFTGAVEAQQTLESLYPDYAETQRNLRPFLRDNPELENRYNDKIAKGDIVGAQEFAYLNYNLRNRTNSDLSGQQEQMQARIDSALTPSGQDAQATILANQKAEQMQAARKAWEENGDLKARAVYLALRLDGITPKFN